jgi:hypothetical protein
MTHGARKVWALAIAVVAALACLVPLRANPASGALVAVGLRQVGQPGHAGLYGWGAATMSDGSVLLGDYWNYRVYHYATDGTLLDTPVTDANQGLNPTQHQSPYGIAVDPSNDDIYFGDVDSNATVDKYSAAGQYLLEWGGKGTTAGKYQYPSQLAVNPVADGNGNHNVYVADQWAHRISVVTPTGTELFRFGTNGTADGQFRQVRGLGFDAQGRLFAVDNYNLRVQVFDAQGNFLFKFGSGGNNPGQFSLGRDLRGLAIDKANDWVYVVDAAGGWIDKFTTSGTFLTRFGGFGDDDGEFEGGGRNITVDGDGNVWVGDMPGFRFQKFSPSGQFLQAVPDPPAPPPNGGFNQPRGVALDAAGNIFVTDTNNWRIQKFDAAGNFVKAWGHRNGPQADGMGFNYARGIAVDRANGDVLVADTDNHEIRRFDNDGNLIWTVGGFGTNPGQFKNPNSVYVDASGLIYVSDTNNFRVQVLTSSGTPIRMFGTKGNGTGQFQFPRGIVADADGSIWVADSIRQRVMHYSATGTYLGEVGSPGANDNQLTRPDGIRVDAERVYVADSDRDKIKIWSKSGSFVGAFGSNGVGLGKFQRPHGIDLTPDGHLWTVEQAGERVQELSIVDVPPDGTPPTGTVSSPSSQQIFAISDPVTFSGTISDAIAVGNAQIDIKQVSTGLWWRADGTWGPFQWQNATIANPGATTSSWSYAWSAPETGDYSVFVRYLDAAGNIGANKPTIPFKVQLTVPVPDNDPPTGTVSSPSSQQIFAISDPVTFSGTISDAIALGKAQIDIKQVSTGLWWRSNGTWGAFQWQDATTASPGATASSWSYSWSAPETGDYSVFVRFLDDAGNIGANKPTIPFKVQLSVPVPDNDPPTGTVSTPAQNQVFAPGAPVTVSGTIADDIAVGNVQVEFKQVSTGLFWRSDGTWGVFQWQNATVPGAGTTGSSWSYQWLPPDAGAYTVQVRFLDSAGNIGAIKPSRSFSVQ